MYTAKRRSECDVGACTLDVERGVTDDIEPRPFQTDTCIGEWHYRRGIHYKRPKTVIDMLVDIVSRNGNLLLNIPLPASGVPDNEELRILDEITVWMKVNSEAIYGTRPWKIFGEGPGITKTAGAGMNGAPRAGRERRRSRRLVPGWLVTLLLFVLVFLLGIAAIMRARRVSRRSVHRGAWTRERSSELSYLVLLNRFSGSSAATALALPRRNHGHASTQWLLKFCLVRLARVTMYEFQRALRYRKGRFLSVLGPGQYWIFEPRTTITPVDVRPNFITLMGSRGPHGRRSPAESQHCG